jgi:hypothetical protein
MEQHFLSNELEAGPFFLRRNRQFQEERGRWLDERQMGQKSVQKTDFRFEDKIASTPSASCY